MEKPSDKFQSHSHVGVQEPRPSDPSSSHSELTARWTNGASVGHASEAASYLLKHYRDKHARPDRRHLTNAAMRPTASTNVSNTRQPKPLGTVTVGPALRMNECP